MRQTYVRVCCVCGRHGRLAKTIYGRAPEYRCPDCVDAASRPRIITAGCVTVSVLRSECSLCVRRPTVFADFETVPEYRHNVTDDEEEFQRTADAMLLGCSTHDIEHAAAALDTAWKAMWMKWSDRGWIFRIPGKVTSW